MLTLEAQIEAILFWKAESLTIPELARVLARPEAEVNQALETLSVKLADRGIALIRNNGEIMFGTSPQVGELIERLTKEELSREIGKAGLETLTVILYRGSVSRAEIDYIRGVNSSFILRNLLIRGLVDKISNPADARSFLYRPTFELLAWLGVKEPSELPDYQRVMAELTPSLVATP
ncbi:MAG: SMC-Scp complex subunit ScpB [Candidatus Vogelbacteria bacterium]